MYPKIIDNSTEQYQLKAVLTELLKSDKFSEVAIAAKGVRDLNKKFVFEIVGFENLPVKCTDSKPPNKRAF